MELCIVVIPVYKPDPNDAECASFRRTLSILHNHDICVVTHLGCALDKYQQLAAEVSKTFRVEFFDSVFFRSVGDYNNLCFSNEFYNRFIQYEYMLIAQLDVWIFDDQLDYWCRQGYDYIGAPIYHAYTPSSFTRKFLGVGNGGFSLRKISHCLRVVNHNRWMPLVKPLEMIRFYWNLGRYTKDFTDSWLRRLGIIPTLAAKIIGIHNNLDFYINNHVNEDLIFGQWANESWGGGCTLPDEEVASCFSFEVHPEYLYRKTGHLPFGCHAFLKWEYNEFWYKYIKY